MAKAPTFAGSGKCAGRGNHTRIEHGHVLSAACDLQCSMVCDFFLRGQVCRRLVGKVIATL